MVRTPAAKAAVAALGGVVAVAALSSPAHADPAVPLNKAGTIVGWGTAGSAPAQTLPADLQGTAFTAADAGSGFTLALTASGKVKVLGTHATANVNIEQVPSSLDGATVTQIDASSNNAGAVTSDGRVVVWGSSINPSEGDPTGADPTDVPAGLAGATSVAISGYSAAAVKTDGTVVVWGVNPSNVIDPPAGLSGVKSIAATGNNGYFALKTDGTVVAWGATTQNQTALPASLSTPGNVKSIAARGFGGLALLTNGKLESWGQNSATSNAVPGGLASKTVVAIAAQSNRNLALDSEGTFWVWGGAPTTPAELTTPPSALTGAEISQISVSSNHAVAVVAKVLEVAKPAITGTAAPGQTLTATPATFSGGPTVTGQWLADGAEIAGATSPTLVLGAAEAGKRISYVSTATKGSAEPVTSVSAQTAVVAVSSTTTVAVTPGAYGTAGRATVTVSNAAGQPVSGTVTLSGAGASQTAPVVGGRASFTLDRRLAPRAYALTASYSGGGAVKASAGTGAHTVGKGKTKAPAFKVSKKPTSKKKGKATVTVSAPSGLVKATGKVTVTIKGKSKKTVKVSLSGGKKSISLPKLKKGSYKVTVSYAGDKNYVAQKSKSFSLKVKK